MPPRLTILNGPNLNLLGTREPEIYGTTTLDTIEADCRACADELGATLAFHQSNDQGRLVDLVHAARDEADALIVNPAGLSFTSYALHDALRAFDGPAIELHISNIHARDDAHRHSVISAAATGIICGLGPFGYVAAMRAAVALLDAAGRR